MSQIEKNTVSAENQLKKSEFVYVEGENNPGVRILFVGNSITLHGIKEEIGWHGHWGMAASAKEKDYVHLLETKVRETHPDAAFCICQAAEWERRYKEGSTVLPLYQAAAGFRADIIVFRLVENCPVKDYVPELFLPEFKNLMNFLNPTGQAKFILSTSFWHHTFDDGLRQIAKELALPLVEMGDLGEMDEMKAIGLFEHSGVAAHPGDLGMQTIADRLWKELKVIL